MIVADIYRLGNKIGEIRWNGSAMSASGTEQIFDTILHQPIWLLGDKGLEDVYAASQPERFIRNLYKHYKGAYLYAAKARRLT